MGMQTKGFKVWGPSKSTIIVLTEMGVILWKFSVKSRAVAGNTCEQVLRCREYGKVCGC
jgi:hypothetical protein